ncbi:amine oxidase domain protein [Natronomonas pharaonis DSM 2160]|uniref:Amine oxidase domain protein n=1 Tax=Natronomonas pharaonis (strain ATCC 35678 / DSM 2160 / CIP 103997 / JCM 8858 / NBRC 14720 / NCIMB 2260 / Gabara) TaxID=348780 RepID=A0A1U7EYP6_NATPD|nr:NAD(P)/FAD-dependent oxidoreductase [Natronomonas pharaonis]CAI50351.1 amine oxidase domain protein [Natronomonas pharaonis DSM 2160]
MIGIVGGGLAGLAAAYRLQQAGHEVRIFEASETVGGLAATYETAGDPIERYYHHLSKSEETIVDLAADLGVADRIEWRVGENAYYVDGVSHPLDTPWEIAAYPYLSVYDKFRLTMLTLEVDVRGGRPRRDTYESLADFEDVPIREFLIEHTTRGVYEYFFEPLLDAKFGDRKEDVSAAWLLGRVKFRGERDLLRGEILGYLDGGFGVFVDALVDAVGREHIETGSRVRELDFAETPDTTGRGPVESLTVADADGDATTHAVDGVVVATMPDVLESLTGYTCDIDFQGSVCAVVSMDESLLDTYWLNIADDAPFGALIEHTNFVPAERYGGEHLLYVASYVQQLADDLWQRSDDEIEALWLDGIADMFPQFDRDRVNWVAISRNPKTAPVYERGYLDMVVPYDLTDDGAPGVYYAGMASRAQYPERSLNGAIEAGFAAADGVLDAR